MPMHQLVNLYRAFRTCRRLRHKPIGVTKYHGRYHLTHVDWHYVTARSLIYQHKILNFILKRFI